MSPLLPYVDWPFAVRQASDAESVSEKVEAWCRRFGLPEGPAIRDFSQASCLAFADSRTDLLPLATMWTLWIFAFDDAFDEVGPVSAINSLAGMIPRVVRTLDGQRLSRPAEPLSAALEDLVSCTMAHVGAAAWKEFAGVVHRYLLGLLWEACQRSTGGSPPLEDFTAMRRMVSAAEVGLHLAEMLCPRPLPPSMWNAESLSELHAAVVDVLTWQNDLVSADKEAALADPAPNLVRTLAEHGALSRIDAYREAMRWRDEAIRRYLAADAELAGLSPELGTHVERIRQLVGGALTWYGRDHDFRSYQTNR